MTPCCSAVSSCFEIFFGSEQQKTYENKDKVNILKKGYFDQKNDLTL